MNSSQAEGQYNLFYFVLLTSTTKFSVIFYYFKPSFLRITFEYKTIQHTFTLCTLSFTQNINLQSIILSMVL